MRRIFILIAIAVVVGGAIFFIQSSTGPIPGWEQYAGEQFSFQYPPEYAPYPQEPHGVGLTRTERIAEIGVTLCEDGQTAPAPCTGGQLAEIGFALLDYPFADYAKQELNFKKAKIGDRDGLMIPITDEDEGDYVNYMAPYDETRSLVIAHQKGVDQRLVYRILRTIQFKTQ